MYLDAPQIKKLFSDAQEVLRRLTMELAMRAKLQDHPNLTKSRCINVRSDSFLQPQVAENLRHRRPLKLRRQR
jgi:hypothetical protein